MISLKRVYDDVSPDDGYRVLVDGLWPRGLSREALRIDEWLKAVAPSTELRRWFGHDAQKWEAFRERYWHELQGASGVVAHLRELARKKLTLVYAAKDRKHNNAVALRDYLERGAS